MNELFSGLNSKQKEAVVFRNGPLFLLAGAGSGKTRTLTYRIAYLISQGVKPWNILALTFTNKAAGEMKERVELILNSANEDENFSSLPTMGTFHSVCAKVLRSEIQLLGFESDFVIYDTQDQISAMKEVLRKMEIDEKKWTPKSMISQISSYKNKMYSPEMLNASAENQYQTMISEIYMEYQKTLKKNNALDFDDLLVFCIQIFQDFPKTLEKYQGRWQYISVDEYQDTNHVQHALIKLLSKKHKNVCVVGDPDQSIYSFRGALIENILHFEKDFPGAQIIKLEQNYRSTKNILSASNSLIQNNQQSAEKKLWTASGDGEKVAIYERKDERDESESIVKLIRSFYENSISAYSENAILYRTNAQSRAMEEALLKYQIPYKIIGGLKFYARKEIKDILAYLRILQNPADSISLLRIINVPARKIGKSSMIKVQAFANARNLSLLELMKHIDMVDNLTPAAKKAFTSFYEMYEFLMKEKELHSLSGFLDIVINETGYRDMLSKEKSIENQSRLENLEELKSVASRYDTLEDGGLGLFLEEVSLVQDSDSIEENEDAVLLMTIHTAKGLEFDNAYIIGAEEELLPHSQSVHDAYQIEEERRLMYVAMTRAKKRLMIFHTLNRTIYGLSKYPQPSRFIGEISADFCQYIPAYSGSFSQSPQPQKSFAQQNDDVQFYEISQAQSSASSRDSDGYVYDEDSQL